MSKPFYQLNKSITFTDHNGIERMVQAGELFHWNHVRFESAGIERIKVIEVARSKVYAAGARMIPCDSSGKHVDLSVNGPDIEIEQIQPVRTGKVLTF